VPVTYQALSDFSKSSPACQPGRILRSSEAFLLSITYHVLSADQIRFRFSETKELHLPAECGTTSCSGEHEASRSYDVGSSPGAATRPFPVGVRLPGGLTWRTLHTIPRGRHFARSGLEHTVFPQVRACFEQVMTPPGATLVTGATSDSSPRPSTPPDRPAVGLSSTGIFLFGPPDRRFEPRTTFGQ
jgi:hypothetical protein